MPPIENTVPEEKKNRDRKQCEVCEDNEAVHFPDYFEPDAVCVMCVREFLSHGSWERPG